MILSVENVKRAQHQGAREYMEDTGFALEVNERFYAAFVFDGHNGAQASLFLLNNVPRLLGAALAKETLAGQVRKVGGTEREVIENTVGELFRYLNEVFRKRRNIAGSTVSGILVDRAAGQILVVTCGDSQVLVYGTMGKELFVSTRDSLDTPKEREVVAAQGVRVAKDSGGMWRLEDSINMSKAFGNFGNSKALDRAMQLTGARKVKTEWLDDVFKGRKRVRIVIGTDGLFDEIPTESFMKSSFLRSIRNLDALLALIGTEGEKRDNITMIVLEVAEVAPSAGSPSP